MQINDLIDRVERLDGGADLARDLRKFVNKRRLGLVYEESKPEYVRLTSKPVVEGDLVNVLPPRGTMEDMLGDDEADEIWVVDGIDGDVVHLVAVEGAETRDVDHSDLVAVARFDQTIYCGLTETGRVERSGDKPYHVVINGENYHALELMLFPYFQSVDCIYIDPPYNTGAKDWKYNNNYVGADDTYRHSKWLTFMEDRLRLAKKLLNPKRSVLIVTIDEKEYLRLGLMLEQLFPEARVQMVTDIIHPGGVSRLAEFSRVEEYLFFVFLGDFAPAMTDDNMLQESEELSSDVIWPYLLRRGQHSRRFERPNLFYPIYVDEANKQIVGAGDPPALGVDKTDYPVPKGVFATWPMHGGVEDGVWQLGVEACREAIKNGHIKLGKKNSKTGWWAVQYISKDLRGEIASGKVEVIGRDKQGALVLHRHVEKSVSAKTVWVRSGHNATEHGSKLIKRVIPGRPFDFPKSLYSVEDVLRFATKDNNEALILDFFSGSGTTAHATMRLNHQDGGRRRSISVTNNEVSFEEAKAFIKRGLRQGDEEWEAHGIARYVTIPRVTAAITGITPEGEPIKGDYKFIDEFPMADGFEENAVFYDLVYLEPSVITANLAFDEIAPLLWMRAGSVGPMVTLEDSDPEDASFEVTDNYGVLFDYAWAPEFIEECHERDVSHIFVVTDVDRQYRDMCAEFRSKDVKQLYKSYLRSFEIGQDR